MRGAGGKVWTAEPIGPHERGKPGERSEFDMFGQTPYGEMNQDHLSEIQRLKHNAMQQSIVNPEKCKSVKD